MPRRMLNFRIAFAVIGAAALAVGVALELPWLVIAGAAAVFASEGIGLRQFQEPLNEPLPRLLRTLAEVAPAVGVAALAPNALFGAVFVAVYAVTASGIDTVAVSRGTPLSRRPGEPLRRVFTSLGNLVLVLVALLPAIGQSVESATGAEPDAVVWMGVAIIALVSVRAITDLALELRRTPKDTR
jgi:hypothetical protein